MTHYFLESSALVKRYVVEQGTAWICAISGPSAGNTIIVASVTQVEVFSGISRRKREGTMSAHTAQTIRILLNRHITALVSVHVVEDMSRPSRNAQVQLEVVQKGLCSI